VSTVLKRFTSTACNSAFFALQYVTQMMTFLLMLLLPYHSSSLLHCVERPYVTYPSVLSCPRLYSYYVLCETSSQVFDYYGVPATSVFGLSPPYFPATDDSTYVTDVGRAIPPGRQGDVLAAAQSSYFFGVVRSSLLFPLYCKTAKITQPCD
jgi:hypothetical protein